jgi:hypothetical protein
VAGTATTGATGATVSDGSSRFSTGAGSGGGTVADELVGADGAAGAGVDGGGGALFATTGVGFGGSCVTPGGGALAAGSMRVAAVVPGGGVDGSVSGTDAAGTDAAGTAGAGIGAAIALAGLGAVRKKAK